MKILFVTHVSSLYGANRSMIQLIRELRANHGCYCFCLIPNTHEDLQQVLSDNNIPYKETDIRFLATTSTNTLERLEYLKYMRSLNTLCEELATMNFDLIHSNSSVIDCGAYISRRLKIKHVWHLREFGDLDYNLHSVLGSRYQQLSFISGDNTFIAISNAVKLHFKDRIPEERVKIIYNGIAISPETKLSKHDNKLTQFICAGIITPQKNQKEIIQAVNVLVNERGVKNFHLTIVGGGEGHYINDIKYYTQKNNISDYVSILPIQVDITELLRQMDVGIMPSQCEAFGRVTVEYMMQNVAVIANDNGANTEIIEDGISGLIYTHNNHIALADKMQELVTDKDKLISLAANGKRRATQCFSSTQNSTSIYNLYEELLSTPYQNNTPLFALYIKLIWLKNIIPFKIKETRIIKRIINLPQRFKHWYRQRYIPQFRRKILPTDCIVDKNE